MSVVKEPVSGSNPFYGCAIMIIAALTFGGIVGWMLYSGYKQDKEIASFTVHDAPSLAASVLTDATREALQKKIDAFSEEAKKDKPATLTLSLEDLNQVIALAGEKKIGDYDYRNVVHFTAMDGKAGRLLANIRWQMNNLPLSKAPDRFLVGSASFLPRVDGGNFDVYLDTVEVPGKTVSPGFIGQLQTIPWLAVSKNNTDVAEVLKHVGAVEFLPDSSALVLKANVGK
ncbi:hypothetical protein [Roseimicrobium gellanilyticum]|nr:hypothetical protein [Roseimicrobium gellanilyticum]